MAPARSTGTEFIQFSGRTDPLPCCRPPKTETPKDLDYLFTLCCGSNLWPYRVFKKDA